LVSISSMVARTNGLSSGISRDSGRRELSLALRECERASEPGEALAERDRPLGYAFGNGTLPGGLDGTDGPTLAFRSALDVGAFSQTLKERSVLPCPSLLLPETILQHRSCPRDPGWSGGGRSSSNECFFPLAAVCSAVREDENQASVATLSLAG
jgi:hypothetical protein